jgi:hypothetical protein
LPVPYRESSKHILQRQVSWLVDLLSTFPPMWLSPVIGSGQLWGFSIVTGLLLKNVDLTFPITQLTVARQPVIFTRFPFKLTDLHSVIQSAP